MLNIFPDISLSGDDWLRIGLIFLFFLLYLSVFFTLGLFVSSRTSRASSSLFVLLFIWVVFIFVVPRVSVMASNYFASVPSIHEVNAEKDAFLQQIQGSVTDKVMEWTQQNPPSPQGDPQEYQQRFRDFLEELQQDLTAQIDKKNAEVEEAYQAKRRTQQTLALNLSRISPASLVTFGALSLAKTGIQEHERFLNSIKTYKPIFTQWVNAKMMQSISFTGQQPKPVLDDMPQHEFVPMSLGSSFSLALPDLVVMVLMIIVLFAGAFVSFLRYDIR